VPSNHIAAQDRVAPASDHVLTGPVTLMNSFAVSPGRDEAFHELWAKTARYFTAQPGFISLRLHRAVSADAQYRWVNVANWESEAHFRTAHGQMSFGASSPSPAGRSSPVRRCSTRSSPKRASRPAKPAEPALPLQPMDWARHMQRQVLSAGRHSDRPTAETGGPWVTLMQMFSWCVWLSSSAGSAIRTAV
jgi:quinol monooxygenase YgiN